MFSQNIKNVVQVGFEPTPPKRLELESSALDHSAIEPLHDKLVIQVKLKTTTPAGFEPARAKPSRFRICLLNLSDKVPEHICCVRSFHRHILKK